MKKLLTLFLLAICFQVNAQKIYSVVGRGVGGYYGEGVPALQAEIWYPSGAVATDAAGNIYVPDYGNSRVRKVTASTGLIATIAGTGVIGYNGDSIYATTAKLNYPTVVALDAANNVYIGEYGGNRIRKIIASTGKIYTIAGDGTYGYNGNNIAASTAKNKQISGIAIDNAGNIYYADMGNSIVRKIDVSSGLVTTVAGVQGAGSYSGDGGPATAAKLNMPLGIALDQTGNLYIADGMNHVVRKVNASTQIISTIAGNSISMFAGDGGLATAASLYTPSSVSLDPWGNLFIADKDNNRVRKVNTAGIITTFAGGGPYSYTHDSISVDSASLGKPTGVYVDPSGVVFESEYANNIVRKISCYNVSVLTTNDKCPGSCDGTINVSALGGVGTYSYTWSGGLGTATTYSAICQGNYTVTVIDSTQCSVNAFANITQPNPISIAITNTNAACLGNGAANTTVTGGTSPYKYAWSNGDTTANISSLAAGHYTLTVTDTNSCMQTKTDTILNYPSPFASVPICMVTVDSISQHNIIVWDKTSYTNVDSFIIYREITTGNYQRLSAQPYSALSQFIDTVRTLYFPNTGNPNSGTYRYKIQTLDTCGTYSLLSPYHNTIYILNNAGTFYWTQLYTIENGANPVSSYILQRDNNSTGNWQQVSSVAGTQQTIADPLYTVYQNTASWRVQTVWNITCTPTLRLNGNQAANTGFNSSFSNTYSNNSTVSVHTNLSDNKLSVYPNPAQNNFTVEVSTTEKQNLQVFDVNGN